MIALSLFLLLLPQEADVGRLAEQLGSDDIDVRTRATQELEKLGKEALQILRTAREESRDAEIRARLAQIIGRIEIRFAQPRRMVYSKGRELKAELYLWEDGRERRLTNNPVMESNPRFSPDGKRIAFSVQAETGGWRTAQARVMTLDGKTVELGEGYDLAWSPDGKRIAIAAADMIRIVDADGAGERTFPGGGRNPVWIAEGTSLACEGDEGIRILDLATGKRRTVLGKRKEYNTLYNWSLSPDGTRFALVAGDGPYIWNVWTVGADGKGLTPRCEEPWIGHGIIQFSPDGKRVAVCVRLGSGTGKPQAAPGMLDDGLHILDLGIDRWQKAAGDVEPILRPLWSPDGKYIVYVATDHSIRIAHREGGATRRLTSLDVPHGPGAMAFPPDACWGGD